MEDSRVSRQPVLELVFCIFVALDFCEPVPKMIFVLFHNTDRHFVDPNSCAPAGSTQMSWSYCFLPLYDKICSKTLHSLLKAACLLLWNPDLCPRNMHAGRTICWLCAFVVVLFCIFDAPPVSTCMPWNILGSLCSNDGLQCACMMGKYAAWLNLNGLELAGF